MHAGGLDKLADIISPSAETLSTQEAAVGALQKTLKSAQAALEGRQAAVFGEQVRLSMTRRCAILHCFCHVQMFSDKTFALALPVSARNRRPVSNEKAESVLKCSANIVQIVSCHGFCLMLTRAASA